MAPAFPALPLSQIQAEDIKKVYHLMYKHIAKEFVHWEDLKRILQNGNLHITTAVKTTLAGAAPPPDYTLKGTGIGSGTQTSTQFIYQDNALGLGRISEHEAEAKVPGSRKIFQEGVKAALKAGE